MDARILQNVLGDRVDVVLGVVAGPHGEQQVEIADGFAAAPQRARGRDRLDRSHAFRYMRRTVAASSSAMLMPDARGTRKILELLRALRMFCSLFSPKPGMSRSFSSRASFSTSATVAQPEIFQRNATFLGPSDCSSSSSRMRGRIFLQQLLAQGVIAGFQDLADVLGHVLADAGQFAEFLIVLGEFFDALVHAEQEFGDFFIGAIAADDGAVDFEQLRGFAEYLCDFAVFHMAAQACFFRGATRFASSPAMNVE